jgi:hypothetical protein
VLLEHSIISLQVVCELLFHVQNREAREALVEEMKKTPQYLAVFFCPDLTVDRGTIAGTST